ncbi:MAG: DUF4124 domain-containing protein [Gallionellaceae bacterium]|nr:DUF4124 domain-containing protein [Gallionellaceae bacterium]
MKLRYFFLLCVLCQASVVQAEIYKRVDANGHVTYSSDPIKGAKKLQLAPLPTMPPPPRSREQESATDFPRVDSATQKGRDNTSRQILEDELASEEKALTEARTNLQTGIDAPETLTGKDGKTYLNKIKQEEKVGALQKEVKVHEKNIALLKKELSNRSK